MRVAITLFVLALTTTIAAVPAAKTRVALPSLTVDDAHADRISLPIDALRIHTLVRGHLARTTYEVTFRNDLDRDLDGQFLFPLPPDAEVSSLGLYFDGRLRRAVAVERVQARAAYEEVVHRRVDPALAEWSASSRAFRFRVYPIPRRGTKVVHIAYDQDLTNAPYELDLRHGEPISNFAITIDSDAPVDRTEGLVRITRDPSEVTLAVWSRPDKSWYYSAPARIRSTARAMPRASAVTLLYDVSSSAIHRDEEKLREFLRRFLALQSDGVRVTVVPFHVFAEPPIETNATALQQRLRDLPHAGATNLVSLFEQLPVIAEIADGSRIVLVTDGIQTIGDSARLARAIDSLSRLGRPLTIVNASTNADDTTLARLASATGGWSIDLTRASASDAATASMRMPARIALMPAHPTVRRIFPSAMTITADATATIHARGSYRLSWFPVGIGSSYRELPIRELSTPEEEDLVRRSWARASLRELLDRGVPPAEVLAHGLRHQQLTPQTSLLVLDTWQDYEAYGIPLPQELRERRKRDVAEEQRLRSRPSQAAIRRVATDAAARRAAWFMRGVVTDGENPFPGVTVEMLVDGTTAASSITDVEGRFWITAQRAPRQFLVRARLEGLETTTLSYPNGAPKGASAAIVMRVAAISESITVTAEAPAFNADGVQTISSSASLARPTAEVLADARLAQLAVVPEDEDDDEWLETRFENIGSVIEKLRSIPSADERFRYYVAARSAIGGEKFFQAQSALAMHEDAPELAVRALTDLAESHPDHAPTLRLIGRVLDGWGFGELARLLFERALELSPRETQTWRELLLLTAKEAPADLAELQRRFETAQRDDRMEQTETALAAELQRRGIDRRIDETVELQVEVMWDTNYTDIDLRVVEPAGEEVSYQRRASSRGGRLHDDVTSGFGPETYTIARMDEGTYQIALDYYAQDNTRVGMQAMAHVIVYVRGERRDYVVALAGEKASVVVAKVTR